MTAVNGLNSVTMYQQLQKLQGKVGQSTIYQSENGDLFNTNGYAVSASGETCTDGKDDGKIGFWSAIGNTLKGVGKTAVNMVKGCFTGKDGKFSLGKTLLTAATAAVCVAFPAVGLVACGIGAVSGAVQIGKGVYNAATADTDAEAKEAWQQVGGGALTTGLSISGAKASYNAVMKTSTANAMASLDKGASIFAKGKALATDMVSSTANRASAIKAAATNAFTNAKATYNEIKSVYNETDIAQARQMLKEARKSGNADDIAAAKQFLNEVKATNKAMAKEIVNEIKPVVKEAVKTKATNLFNTIKSNLNKEGLAKVASKLKGAPRAIANKIAEGKISLDQLVSQYGYDNVIEVLEILGATESI